MCSIGNAGPHPNPTFKLHLCSCKKRPQFFMSLFFFQLPAPPENLILGIAQSTDLEGIGWNLIKNRAMMIATEVTDFPFLSYGDWSCH